MKSRTQKFLLFAFLLYGLMGCREEERPNYGISIEGIPGDTTMVQYSTMVLNIIVTAKDGLSSFKIGNTAHNVVGLKTYSYDLVINASLNPDKGPDENTYHYIFHARDKNGDVMQKEFQVRIIPAPGDDSSENPNVQDTTTYFVNSDINHNQVWKTGKIYILDGRISVLPDVKLTIQKGAIIKGTPNQNEISSLVVARGAQIDAQGTEVEPIIFTSALDYIIPGTVEPRLSVPFFDESRWDWDLSNQKGLWGGLIILGKAPGSFPGDVQEMQAQGIPESDIFGKYGGTDDQDNSGILKNILIRFAGNKWKSNQRTSAMTLAGVGSGTHIENVEIVESATDGISIHGGSVKLQNILVNKISEDGFAIYQGWSGVLDNYIVINTGYTAFEIKGPAGSFYQGKHSIINGLIISGFAYGIINFQDNANTDISKVLIGYLYGLKYGINLIPEKYNSIIDQWEVISELYDFGEEPLYLFNSLFKDFKEGQIKLVESHKISVGPHLSKFNNWSWGLLNYKRNGSVVHGL